MIGFVIDVWERTKVDELTIGGAAILSAATVIWTKAIRPTVGAFRQGARAWQYIEEQMQPNGGESLRDKVDELTKNLAQISEAISLLPELTTRLAQVEQQLQELRKESTP